LSDFPDKLEELEELELQELELELELELEELEEDELGGEFGEARFLTELHFKQTNVLHT
jgi:hypothetical protein